MSSGLKQEFPNAQPALGYGLTETNAVGCANFWSSYAAKPASTGRAQKPLVEVAILGDGDQHPAGRASGRDRHPHRGQHQMLLGRSARRPRRCFHRDGYVRTGDVGYLDEDGYLFIVDRKKEIIIRGGENISAAEVEAECYACPAIAEVAVFGAPDERLGEVPVAIVHLKNGERLDEDDLRAFLDGQARQVQDPRAHHLLR